MPTPRIYNKHVCPSCGMPSAKLSLLNSHYQRNESHRIVDSDIVMQEVGTDDDIPTQADRKLNIYVIIFRTIAYVYN